MGHSYINGYRFANLGDIKEYLSTEWIVSRNSEKDDITVYNYRIKKIEGISLKDFEDINCDLYKESIDKHRKDGLWR